jgi:hypothetical protein
MKSLNPKICNNTLSQLILKLIIENLLAISFRLKMALGFTPWALGFAAT